ncbi:MAG: hypothetical protein J6Q60_06095 [Bacteroidaceae bacterium]|nr:hypothetical protein [Bacteroidaceae bacterium]
MKKNYLFISTFSSFYPSEWWFSLVCCEALGGFLMQSPIGPGEASAGASVKKVCLVGNNG